jgi:restriction system protein
MGNYVLVRSPSKLISEGQIGYGWSKVNFSEFSTSKDLLAHFKLKNLEIGRNRKQIVRYFNISEGDVVIVPLDKSIIIGFATGKKSYQAGIKHGENRLSVEFLKGPDNCIIKIPRSELPGNLSSRLKIRMSVVSLNEFKSEIERIISTARERGAAPANLHIEELNKAAEDAFKQKLLANIRQGKTYLKSGGRGLEELVLELVELEGYKGIIAAKNALEGIADIDIEASRTDLFSSTKLLIQVKHHDGTTGVHGIKQLEALDDDDEQVLRWLVTTAEVSNELRKRAENNNIKVMDGNELIKWVFESLPSLSPATRSKLGISDVPALLLE